MGPVDIVIEGDRIAQIQSVGFPGVPINEDRRPGDATREIDMTGMYIMPGFVDMHAHTGGGGKAPQPEYTYKLWMGTGSRLTRRGSRPDDVGARREGGIRPQRDRRAAHVHLRAARRGVGRRPGRLAREGARLGALGRQVDVEGAKIDGLKLGSLDPDIMAAVIDEAHRHGLGTVAHLGRWVCRHDRAGRRRGGARHDDALLRPYGVHADRLQRPELATRLQLPGRAAPLRQRRAASGTRPPSPGRSSGTTSSTGSWSWASASTRQ